MRVWLHDHWSFTHLWWFQNMHYRKDSMQASEIVRSCSLKSSGSTQKCNKLSKLLLFSKQLPSFQRMHVSSSALPQAFTSCRNRLLDRHLSLLRPSIIIESFVDEWGISCLEAANSSSSNVSIHLCVWCRGATTCKAKSQSKISRGRDPMLDNLCVTPHV